MGWEKGESSAFPRQIHGDVMPGGQSLGRRSDNGAGDISIMKRKTAVLLSGVLAAAMLLAGCASNSASNEYVTVGGYKGIEVKDIEEPEEVDDEKVDEYIQAVMTQYSTQEEIKEGEVKSGDTVNIDFTGKMDGETFEGGSAEGYSLEIGSGSFIPGFEDSIIGHKPGDTFDWDGNFPDPYSNNPDFSGKPVTFTIKVNYICGETILPELTDEFVQTVSEKSKTVEEYKKEIEKQLTENGTTDFDSQLQEAAWQAVFEKVEIKGYPDGELEKVKKQMIDPYKEAAEAEEMEFGDFLQQYYGIDEEEFEKQAEDAAKDSIEQNLVAEVIAEHEKLMPDDKELEKEYKKMAKDYGFEDVDSMKESAGDEQLLKDIVVMNRVKEFLAENAVQVKE